MKCLFLNTYYSEFLKEHYKRNKIAHLEYMEQWDSIQGSFFGDSDFYSKGLEKCGWWAHDLIINAEPLQRAWARENDYKGNEPIWIEQIRQYEPDVVYTQGLWLQEQVPLFRDRIKIFAGQHQEPTDFIVPNCDVVFTSMPHHVDQYRENGTPAHYLKMGFAPIVLEDYEIERDIPVSFVGGLTAMHSGRIAWLRELGVKIPMSLGAPIDFWGYGYDQVEDIKGIRYHGAVWGKDMFRILRRSRITLNNHIDCAEDYANNMRLYEATGCGALLITDNKLNLGDLFVLGEEVVAYDSVDGCVNAIKHYTDFPYLARRIAEEGQIRTLSGHTYDQCMVEVAEVLEGMLKNEPT